MIGGIDIRLPARGCASSVAVAVSAIRQRWASAVFENGLTGQRYDQQEQIPFEEIEELFVYRDEASADAWDAEGAVPSVFNTMIHLVANLETLTVVVDERDELVEEMVSAISAGLMEEALSVREANQA